MKKWRRVVAAALAGVMIVSSMGLTVFADEPQNEITYKTKQEWVFEDNIWRIYQYNYHPETGELVSTEIRKNRIKVEAPKDKPNVKPRAYYVDADGEMASNELLYVVHDREDSVDKLNDLKNGRWFQLDAEGNFIDDVNGYAQDHKAEYEIMYAYPDGHLAVNQWVKLDENGQRSYDEDKCLWYYFDERGFALRDGIHIITEKKGDMEYCFHPNGVMASGEWYNTEKRAFEYVDVPAAKFSKSYYYLHDGYKARGKKVIDGEWYKFDNQYNFAGIRIDENMPSAWADAQANTIVAVEPEDVDATIYVGETIELTFNVTLASPSNAEAELDQYHDIYIAREFDEDDNPGMMTKSTWISKKSVSKDQVVVEYSAEVPGIVEVELWIDGDLTASVPVISEIPNEKVAEGTKKMVSETLKNSGDGLDDDRLNVLKEIVAAGSEEERDAFVKEWADSIEGISSMEESYKMSKSVFVKQPEVSDAVAEEFGSNIGVAGAALNMTDPGIVQLVVDIPADAEEVEESYASIFEDATAVEIDLEMNGEKQSELDLPVVIQMPVPDGFTEGDVILHRHMNEDGELQVDEITSDNYSIDNNGIITFTVDKFSTFVFAQEKEDVIDPPVEDEPVVDDSVEEDPVEHVSSSNKSESTGAEVTEGVVTIDAQKGQVNSVTGIVTGAGEGYSSWIAGTAADGSTTWKLKYADGTVAAGAIKTRADGTTYEQPAWEKVNGNWYAFGADALAMSSWVADEALGGWFYVDINCGMLTGWQEIGSIWYYLNPISNGKKGICMMNTWIDGWYVGATGAWDGKAQVAAQ